MRMKKSVKVFMSDEMYERLKRANKRIGAPMLWIIRKGIDQALKDIEEGFGEVKKGKK